MTLQQRIGVTFSITQTYHFRHQNKACCATNRLYHRISTLYSVISINHFCSFSFCNAVIFPSVVHYHIFIDCRNFHVWEVKRSEEFSPLKNSENIGKDCMSTCRRDYYAECKRWLIKANVPICVDRPIFIHPLYSYSGEVICCNCTDKLYFSSI